MLAKMTSKNQLTLPKRIIDALARHHVSRSPWKAMFIHLALSAGVDMLVSGDRDIAGLDLGVPVVSAAELRRVLSRDEQGEAP